MMEGLTDQIEILMEDGLEFRVEGQCRVRVAQRFAAEMQSLEAKCLVEELLAGDQLLTHRLLVGKRFLVTNDRLFVPDTVNPFAAPGQVLGRQNGLRRQGVEQGRAFARFLADLRDDVDALQPFLAELCLHVEGPDRLDLATEKVDTIGELAGVGEDIENTTTDSVLSGLVDVIDMLEAIFVEYVGDEHIIDLLADMDLKRVLLQNFPVGNPFGQRVGIGDDDKRFVRTLQKTQRLGSQDLVSRVDVPVLDGPSIDGGEKVDPVTIGQLVQVVIKITRLLLVVQQAKESAAAFGE